MSYNYAVEQRLRMIDFLLFYYGSVGREELVNYFGISPATATRDFSLYLEKAPSNAILNNKTKRYIKSECFERIFK